MTARSADRISFREEEDPIRGIYGFIMPFRLSLLLPPFVLEPRFQEDEPFTPFRKNEGVLEVGNATLLIHEARSLKRLDSLEGHSTMYGPRYTFWRLTFLERVS